MVFDRKVHGRLRKKSNEGRPENKGKERNRFVIDRMKAS